MVSFSRQLVFSLMAWIAFVGLGALVFGSFFREIFHAWLHDENYSFGILIPPLVAFLVWSRRGRILNQEASEWLPGLLLVLVGCSLQVLASGTGTLLESGAALIIVTLGCVGYLWGKRRLAVITGPILLLLLMVPLPAYAVGELSWYLQSGASTASGAILGFLGVPVYQDGNLLRLPNYILEVKQACSGSRSIFALLALAFAIGLTSKSKSWIRVLLIVAAPLLALAANVVRIVGTGLIARKWGNLAANESLHEAWGIAVFLMAVLGLVGIQSLLRRVYCKNA
jgi:exosortase